MESTRPRRFIRLRLRAFRLASPRHLISAAISFAATGTAECAAGGIGRAPSRGRLPRSRASSLTRRTMTSTGPTETRSPGSMSPASSRRMNSPTVRFSSPGGDVDRIGARDVAQLGVRLQREFAVEPRIVGARRTRPANSRSSSADILRRGDDVDLVAGLRAAEAVRAQRPPVADDERRPRPARNALALGDRAFRMDDVGDDLVVAAARQFQFDAIDRARVAPARSGRGSAPSGRSSSPAPAARPARRRRPR